MAQRSSGLTAVATTDDTAVDAITNDGISGTHVRITNEGAAPGFYSTDGGTTYHRLPALGVVTDDYTPGTGGINGVKVKRVASGTNLSSVFVSIW